MGNTDESTIHNDQLLVRTVLNALASEKYITVEQANTFCAHYGIVRIKPKWFQNVFNKLFPVDVKTPNSVYYKVVKFVADIGSADVSVMTDINELKNLLAKAENEEDFELAEKIQMRIKSLGGDIK